jgi:hypothetical protein
MWILLIHLLLNIKYQNFGVLVWPTFFIKFFTVNIIISAIFFYKLHKKFYFENYRQTNKEIKKNMGKHKQI